MQFISLTRKIFFVHLPKCEINPSVCFTIDLAQQFGLKVQTTHIEKQRYTHAHTRRAEKLTYPLSVVVLHVLP